MLQQRYFSDHNDTKAITFSKIHGTGMSHWQSVHHESRCWLVCRYFVGDPNWENSIWFCKGTVWSHPPNCSRWCLTYHWWELAFFYSGIAGNQFWFRNWKAPGYFPCLIEMHVMTQNSHTLPPLLYIIKKMALCFDFIGKELACLQGGDHSRVGQSFISCANAR